jgi:hypothetical protein
VPVPVPVPVLNSAAKCCSMASPARRSFPGGRVLLASALQPRMSELARFASSSGWVWSAMFTPADKRVVTTDDKSAQM